MSTEMTDELMAQAINVNLLMKEVNTLTDRVNVSREHLGIVEAELDLKRRLFKREEAIYHSMLNERFKPSQREENQ